MKSSKGFTVIELLVVVVVIVILAAIVIVSYGASRDRAMDVKIRTAVKTAGEAIAIYESENDELPSGVGEFDSTDGVDSLVPGLLKIGYRDNLASENVSSSDKIMVWYPCTGSTAGFAIYASLSRPSHEDEDSFTRVRTACGHTGSLVPGPSGSPPLYNYAQMF